MNFLDAGGAGVRTGSVPPALEQRRRLRISGNSGVGEKPSSAGENGVASTDGPSIGRVSAERGAQFEAAGFL